MIEFDIEIVDLTLVIHLLFLDWKPRWWWRLQAIVYRGERDDLRRHGA